MKDKLKTSKDLVEWLNSMPIKDIGDGYTSKDLAPRVECSDGTTLSIQASEGHYCTPRKNEGQYYKVEVGFPSVTPPETWKSYFDGNWDEGDGTGSVYGYIPVDLVIAFIEEHGGCKKEAI